MCGILGWASFQPVEEGKFRRSLATLSHRGPDDEGVYFEADRRLALGHQRLSIIDLSAAGRQPMGNAEGTLWIVFNGEIYNHPELRAELLSKGHRFRSKTDTEVILHLYQQEGEAAIERLVGMFALAIYDRPRNRLLLARDRLGVKPLYYSDYGGSFAFASEIKAILALDAVPVSVDWQAISDYFTFLFVPHPQTAFAAVRQLPPANLLSYDLGSRRLSTRRYWTAWDASNGLPHSQRALQEQLRTLLDDVVRGEMISDVPVGLFFSGGIDSTLLAALMRRHSKEKIKTFTVGFRGEAQGIRDDLPYARLASRALGTEHRELLVELTTMEDFLGLIRHFDQPFANPTFYLQYLIARVTRQHVTVALTGVGADELFGGYPRYHLIPWARALRRVPAGSGRLLRRALSLMPEGNFAPLLRRAKRVLKGAGQPFAEQYVRWSYYLTEEEKRGLFMGPLGSGHFPAVRMVEQALEGMPEDPYSRLFQAELQTFLAGNLLEYTDKMTMAVGLEARVPFLDHRLVELGARLPFHDKVRGGRSKVLLRETFKDLIPEEIARAPKRGFAPPIGQWMRQILDRYFERVLSEKTVRKEGLFRWETLQRVRNEHRLGRRDASMDLLAVILFDVWFRRYILNQQPIAEVAA